MSIKINNLTAKIKDNIVLNNVNLEINKGDVVLIIGPNGHGKSTILKTLMKHYDTKITSGEIYINNVLINNLTTSDIASELKVFFAMQNPVEIPGLTMIELLRNEASKNNENLSVLELYKIVNKKMQDLQMNPELLNRSINSNFSGGEKKKSEIIQLDTLNPDIILLDEIDSGLDVDAIDLIANVLQKHKEQGKTIIYISHNKRLLEKLVPNKVFLLINGQIVESGDCSLADKVNDIGYKKYASQKGIQLKENNEFLKDTIKGFNCGKK